MIKISELRALQPVIICLGSHPAIIQSMLDYAYCLGQQQQPLAAIVSGGRKQERYFWGESEFSVPVYPTLQAVPEEPRSRVNSLLNVQSARRVLAGMQEAFELLPNLKVANIFAEQVPEEHAQAVAALAQARDALVAGPASVGVLIPGILKLGAIGGTQYPQIVAANIFQSGNSSVVSTSGGMVNELIHTVTRSGLSVSFAVALGGDRYPITSPAEACLLAESDETTKQVIYFGELGGKDEYEIAELVKAGKLTKPIIAYIAGTVAELFAEPPQFGHAKAMAGSQAETAAAKKEVLRAAGAKVLDVFADLAKELSAQSKAASPATQEYRAIKARRKSLAVSHISGDINDDVHLLGKELLEAVEANSLAGLYISMLLGREVSSVKLVEFSDYIFRLLVDHGPYSAGAVNTIVAARAGKDLASSLASGLLTIGPRFGGAVNAAADGWLNGVQDGASAKDFVANYKINDGIIFGIGHKKYRIDLPDPRVAQLAEKFSGNTNGDRYLNFARAVEAVTTAKKGNLILNIDGAIAALMLDILESELGYGQDQLQELIDIEFFNAVFIASRAVGLSAHYLDQRRNDEGLLRLGEDDILYLP